MERKDRKPHYRLNEVATGQKSQSIHSSTYFPIFNRSSICREMIEVLLSSIFFSSALNKTGTRETSAAVDFSSSLKLDR